jgi:hypothetical protein
MDWECKVQRLYADGNMGCKGRLSTGLSWVVAGTCSNRVKRWWSQLVSSLFCCRAIDPYRRRQFGGARNAVNEPSVNAGRESDTSGGR